MEDRCCLSAKHFRLTLSVTFGYARFPVWGESNLGVRFPREDISMGWPRKKERRLALFRDSATICKLITQEDEEVFMHIRDQIRPKN